MQKSGKPADSAKEEPSRDQRLAAALRENLKRRKARARSQVREKENRPSPQAED
jgi:hypothetical protein